jgi:hypothetical protein
MTQNKSDHALAVIKAALNAVPIVGGSIASLIGDYVPLSTQRSLETATKLLAERLERLESRIDVNAVNKDEFSDLFKSCYLVIVRTTQESKLRAAAAILANLLLRPGDPKKLSYTELDHFVRCVDVLSTGAITTLGRAYELFKDRGTYNLETGAGYRFNFSQLYESCYMHASLLMGVIGELNAMNLLHMPGVPAVREQKYANYALELTPLGIRFVEELLHGI